MNIRNRLWLVFSLLFILVCLGLYGFIVKTYEERVLAGQREISITQGQAVVEQLSGTYPRFPERTEGYLSFYSDRLDARLLVLDYQKKVRFDSFEKFTPGTHLSLTILEKGGELPRTEFVPTTNYGYVQYTLFPLGNETPASSFLLMIKDVNVLYEDIRSFQYLMMAVMALAIMVFFLLSFWLAAWFSRPIHDIVRHLQGITPQKRTFTMEYNRKDEIQHLVRAIRQMVDQLNQYELRQRQFISASSHELKTPLTTMQLICENLEHVREDPGQFREFTQDLLVQTDKMKKVVEDLLHINRMWDRPLNLDYITGGEIRNHIEKQFQRVLDSRGLFFRFTIDADAHFEADWELFFHGVDNLVANAIRYSSENKEIHIGVQKDGDTGESLLFVCDEGIGIAEEDRPYIFEPFYRSKQAMDWDREGTGLGLVIVKLMADRHGGKLELESSVGKGTCVRLKFGNKIVTQRQLL